MPVKQVREEALQQGQTVTWRDVKFTIPPVDDWLMDYMHFEDRQQFTRALEVMLGPDQYEVWRSKKPKPKDLETLMNTIRAAFDLEGEA